jgi:hypothetical protein
MKVAATAPTRSVDLLGRACRRGTAMGVTVTITNVVSLCILFQALAVCSALLSRKELFQHYVFKKKRDAEERFKSFGLEISLSQRWTAGMDE